MSASYKTIIAKQTEMYVMKSTHNRLRISHIFTTLLLKSLVVTWLKSPTMFVDEKALKSQIVRINQGC